MQKQTQVRVWKAGALPADWFKRQKTDEKATQQVENDVKAIINQVKGNGDKALVEFALKFDKAKLTPKTLKVTDKEIKEAYKTTSQKQITAIKFMQKKVSAFQKKTDQPNRN